MNHTITTESIMSSITSSSKVIKVAIKKPTLVVKAESDNEESSDNEEEEESECDESDDESDDEEPEAIHQAKIAIEQYQAKVALKKIQRENAKIITGLRAEACQVSFNRILTLKAEIAESEARISKIQAGDEDEKLLAIHNKPSRKSGGKSGVRRVVRRKTYSEVLKDGDVLIRTTRGAIHGSGLIYTQGSFADLDDDSNYCWDTLNGANEHHTMKEGKGTTPNAWKAYHLKRDGILIDLDSLFVV